MYGRAKSLGGEHWVDFCLIGRQSESVELSLFSIVYKTDCRENTHFKNYMHCTLIYTRCILMQYVKLMSEVCHLLTVLTIFGCSNMLRWKLSLKNRHE
jgi:hypothetical protein